MADRTLNDAQKADAVRELLRHNGSGMIPCARTWLEEYADLLERRERTTQLTTANPPTAEDLNSYLAVGILFHQLVEQELGIGDTAGSYRAKLLDKLRLFLHTTSDKLAQVKP